MATTENTTKDWSQWYLATDEGKELAEFTTCLSVSISMEGEVVNEPIENGSFASYNKTIAPVSVKATVVKQGTVEDLNTILETVRKLQTGTDLFSFLTPEREFRNMTLETFDYERKREEGLNVLTLNLQMKEIKQVSVSYTTVAIPAASTKDPSAASTQQGGQKTPEKATLESSAFQSVGVVVGGSSSSLSGSGSN